MEPVVIAVDVGTSSVRAQAMNLRGQPVGPQVRRESPVHYGEDGAAELDARALRRAVEEALAELGASLAGTAPLAVGMATLWHGLLGLDRRGEPVTPIYTWADTRGRQQARRLGRSLDPERVRQATGAPLHPSFWPSRILWLREERPELWERVVHLVSPADYLYLCWFGTLVTSVSLASATGMLDRTALTWDPGMMAHLGLDARMVPEIGDNEALWEVSSRARVAGLPPVPFLLAVGDGAASNVGSGCVQRHVAAVNLGTSGAVRCLWRAEQGPPSIPPGLFCYRLDQERVLVGGAVSGMGNFLRWLSGLLQAPSLQEVDRALREPPAGAHTLTVLPHVAGERSPGWAPGATGAVVGLTLGTRPLDLMVAGVEGAVHSLAAVCHRVQEAVPEVRALVAGGGVLTALPAVARVLADSAGMPVHVLAETEATLRGAGLLALARVVRRPLEEVATADLGSPVLPDPGRVAYHREGMRREESLARQLRPLWEGNGGADN